MTTAEPRSCQLQEYAPVQHITGNLYIAEGDASDFPFSEFPKANAVQSRWTGKISHVIAVSTSQHKITRMEMKLTNIAPLIILFRS